MAEEEKKTKRPTAQKRVIQSEKRRMQNRSFKSKVNTAVRSFEKQVADKDVEAAKAQLNTLFSLLDKGVKNNIYKLNKASRLKAKFANRIA